MVGIIVVGNKATPAQIQSMYSALGTRSADAMLVAELNPAQTAKPENFISTSSMTLSSCLRQALKQSKGTQVILIDARISANSASMSTCVEALSNESSSAVAYMPLSIEGDTITLQEFGAESICQVIANQEIWPMIAFSMSRTLINQMSELQGESMLEVAMRALIQASSNGDVITAAKESLNISGQSSIAQPENSARARCMAIAIEQINIEDLFPQHAWTDHQGESAAAAYHKLAAMFIRLGDCQTAASCLDLSDQFEDSPRSLALKGMIALSRGETLAAVANMVSSLQQYEQRKKKSAEHYLSFEPNNLEVINTSLSAGLEALNKRNNQGALEYFAEAIFNFDSLYAECGVKNIRSLMQ